MTHPLLLQVSGWEILTTRLREIADGAQQGGINLLLAIAVGLVGWGVAALAAWLLRTLLRATGFNRAIRGMLTRETRHEPAALASRIVYVILVASALMLALDTLGLNISAPVSARLMDVVPRILAAGAILGVGFLLSLVLGAVTRSFLDRAGFRAARPIGQVMTAVLTAFTGLIAIDQLGFAAQFVMALGITAFASLGIAVGLAFGLGCRDLARDFVIEYLRSLESEGPRRPAP